ncbi:MULTISPECIES: hypothetical protein [unclassified Kitasatospora]|uniref:hypothetical protein n=1 Tax=unclassified Kitasatospora TaxID=2633591 RepID=UPI001ADFAB67|nr:hypothetical protein [Kitasatospora sp. RG8]MBP0454439.1 hypothetical protein [Kitasatospora sp. RG8]
MPSTTGRPPGTAVADGPADSRTAGGARTAPGTPTGRPADGGAGTGPETGAADDAVDGRVDDRAHGTTQAPSGPGVGSAEWDLLTDDIRWSDEVFRLLGCDPGRGPLSLDRLPDRVDEPDRPQLRRMMTDALVHGRHAYGTLQVRHPCGGRGAIECAGEPVLGTDGTVTALRLLLRPVVDHR